MLYKQIRHAHTIRDAYRIRHQLIQKKKFDLGTRLGYPKRSKQFCRVKSVLTEEQIFNRYGMFVESPINIHMAKMPLLVKEDQIRVLGDPIPYYIFLSLVAGTQKRYQVLAEEFGFSRMGVYNALRRMKEVDLVSMSSIIPSINDESAYRWFKKYLDLVTIWIDLNEDISDLFNTVPTYIDGPMARYMLDYEPGRPLIFEDMQILTHEPFLGLVEDMIENSQYLKDRHTEVNLLSFKGYSAASNRSAFKNRRTQKIVQVGTNIRMGWIDKIPYCMNIDGTHG